jgi:hypothetical protein
VRAGVVALSIACTGCQLILGIQADVQIIPDEAGFEASVEPDAEADGVVLRDASAPDAADGADAELHKDASSDASSDGG